MSERDDVNAGERWAELRFAIVGPLLAAPPARGRLRERLKQLAEQSWRHPVTGEPVRFGVSTIERWFYAARAERSDPIGVLRRRVRKDAGVQRSLSERLQAALRRQHREHPGWTYQLHRDNLAALARQDAKLGEVPSYPTVRRFMRAQGMRRRPRPRRNSPGAELAAQRLEQREVRSFESDYVAGLWHLDYHDGSRRVVSPSGSWEKVFLFGVLDDRSRVACHAQWYLAESAETLAHGLSQAIQKRGLPRSLMTDNGSAMRAAETARGLHTLGIVHYPTLPHSAYQNAKQETFWGNVEGRLMAMLEGCDELTLELLNEATCAWVDMEYNRRPHSELGCSPMERFLHGPDVSRPSPTSDELRQAFRAEITRRQRRSDGTVTVEGVRFEVPSRFRHLDTLRLRYARWDLRCVDLVDPRSGVVSARLRPLDKSRNADGLRRRLTPTAPVTAEAPASGSGMAPLLRQLIADYAATGLPPAYLPHRPPDDTQQED